MGQNLDYQEIGRNIRYYRQKAGMKQNRLSEIIDISPQHISHIESGVKLSLSVLVRIANALDVDVNCLLGSNLNRSGAQMQPDALMERVKALSPSDREKLIQICDIIFP